MGINLVQNCLDLGIDKSKVYIVDYGLTQNQIDFLNELEIRILARPEHLLDAHPYKLKSHLFDFLSFNDIERDFLVQLDADMIMLNNPDSALKMIVSKMIEENLLIAICQDVGPSKNILEFASTYRCPNFKESLSPDELLNPYLNSGFVIYSPHFNLKEFQDIADAMEGEVVWEQNALNTICAKNPNSLLMLDPSIWNMHGILIEQFNGDTNPFLLHITSPTPNSIGTGFINFHIGDVALEPVFYRELLVNPYVHNLQTSMIQNLLTKNANLFIHHFAKNS
ncbi:hypothetical protein [Polynucleobacter sphagniphilus]|uniref:hypothetical protein n=1 Tax=Polynucleobacter sphagniphilus TaxID=1743169 RepID=UPI002474DA0A|nr:hypothetical protein [Polynucleobacter sphagniphilus]